MKHVLLLCEAYGGGLKTYIDAVSASRFAHVKLATCISSARTSERPNEAYRVVDQLSFGRSPMKLLYALKQMHQLIRQQQIDVLHANSTLAGVLLVLYKLLYRARLRYIYTPHGYYSFKQLPFWRRALVRSVERVINASSDRVIHVSKSEEEEALRYKIVQRDKSVVIFNGIAEPKKIVRQKEQKFTIVNVARVEAQKNPLGFIQLADRVLRMDLAVQFIWAGDGRLLEDMRRVVEQLGWQQQIQFIGHVQNPYELLASAHVYCSTSFYEGLPFSVVEAMAHRLPLLLSNNVGHQDLINGENGLLFELGDWEAAGAWLDTLQRVKQQREAMAHGSYKLFQERFQVQPMLQQLEAVYMA